MHIFAISPGKHGGEVLIKLIVSLLVCVARHAQDTQNNKFSISSQHLQENVNDKVDFSPAGKYQRFLQIGTVILGVTGLAGPNNPK